MLRRQLFRFVAQGKCALLPLPSPGNSAVLRRFFATKAGAGKKKKISTGSDETLASIKEKLRAAGLSVTGKKDDLILRLQEAQKDGLDGSGRGVAKKESGVNEKSGALSIEEEYQKMSPIEHVLLRPDIYVGSMQPVERKVVVVDIGAKGGDKSTPPHRP